MELLVLLADMAAAAQEEVIWQWEGCDHSPFVNTNLQWFPILGWGPHLGSPVMHMGSQEVAAISYRYLMIHFSKPLLFVYTNRLPNDS